MRSYLMDIMIDFWKRYDIQSKTLNLTKKEVAAIANINYTSFINYAAKDRIPKTEEAVKIAKAIGTTVEFLISGEDVGFDDELPAIQTKPHHEYETPNGKIHTMAEEPTILVPLAPQKISAGPGEEFLPSSKYIGYVRILGRMARGIDPLTLMAVTVKGDSMTGVQIFEGDVVFFARQHISENGIYVISLFGEVKVKRLEFRAAEQVIYIHSENARYSMESVRMDNENMIILGKVVGWVHCHPY